LIGIDVGTMLSPPRQRVGAMHHNRSARFDDVLALSAGILSGVVLGAMSGNMWKGISTGSAIAAAFVLARLLIRG